MEPLRKLQELLERSPEVINGGCGGAVDLKTAQQCLNGSRFVAARCGQIPMYSSSPRSSSQQVGVSKVSRFRGSGH